MRPKLSISGIRDLHDARYCAAVGIDMLGFYLDPAASHFHTAMAVREMAEWLSGPEIVAEYESAPAELILENRVVLPAHRVRVPYRPDFAVASLPGVSLILTCPDHLTADAALSELLNNKNVSAEISASAAALVSIDPQKYIIRVHTPEELLRFAQFTCMINALVMHPDGSIDYERCDALLDHISAG